MRPAFVTLVAATALLAAGCGAVPHMEASDGDAPAGKKLFVQSCGQCHSMKDAGTKGTLGPNLDDAFGPARRQGFDESTFRDVVRGQIAYPETETATEQPGMPANILVGQQARDVADYVAECAGTESACDLR